MNSIECDEVYQELEVVLAEYGIEWITQQTRSRINLGITYEKTISRKTNFVIESRDYTSQDRLKILLDNIQKFICDTVQIEIKVIEFFAQNENFISERLDRAERPERSQIKFLSNDFNNEEIYLLNSNSINDRLKKLDTLNQFITEIKSTIDFS